MQCYSCCFVHVLLINGHNNYIVVLLIAQRTLVDPEVDETRLNDTINSENRTPISDRKKLLEVSTVESGAEYRTIMKDMLQIGSRRLQRWFSAGVSSALFSGSVKCHLRET